MAALESERVEDEMETNANEIPKEDEHQQTALTLESILIVYFAFTHACIVVLG